MQKIVELQERRTSADVVFDYLHDQITSLAMMPGDKISEAEIAAKFGVSRQPVRDAFSRLGNLDLLLVRPQKATEVRKFSLRSIATARFVRLAVELEVLRKAATGWTGAMLPEFERNIALQHKAVKARDVDAFHARDYDFHRLLCRSGNAEFAFDIIAANKARVDRLCVLSMTSEDGMPQLVADHERLIEQLKNRDEAGVQATIRIHLSRLDSTIQAIHAKHAHIFDDD